MAIQVLWVAPGFFHGYSWGFREPVSEVMPDTAQTGTKTQVKVDGRVLKNVTYGHSKRRLFAD